MEKIKEYAVAVKDWVMIAPYRFFVGAGIGFAVGALLF